MMKRSLLVMALAMVSIAAVLPAWTQEVKEEEKKVELKAKNEEKMVEMERRVQSGKDILEGNINALQNQEMRVTLLQQILNDETAKLRQMEAVFCDHYNLELEKYRAREYQYDANTGKFIEKKK